MVGKATYRNFTLCKAALLGVLIVAGFVLAHTWEPGAPQVARDGTEISLTL